MISGKTGVKFNRLAIGLSLLTHAVALLFFYVLWNPVTLAPEIYVEVELAEPPGPAAPLQTAPAAGAAPPGRTEPDGESVANRQPVLSDREIPPQQLPQQSPDPAERPATPEAVETGLQGKGSSSGLSIVPPRVREKPPSIPSVAGAAGVKGVVVLTAEILEDGRIGRLVVVRSSGSALLDAAAREYVARWRFEAARLPPEGKPVRVLTSVLVRYD